MSNKLSDLSAFALALEAFHNHHPMGSGRVGLDPEPITQEHEVYKLGRRAMSHYPGEKFPGANDGTSDWFWILIESSRNEAAPCHVRSGASWRLLQWCKSEIAAMSLPATKPKRKRGAWVGEAVILINERPNISNKDIADACNIDEAQVSRNEVVRKARQMNSRSVATGFVVTDKTAGKRSPRKLESVADDDSQEAIDAKIDREMSKAKRR